MTGELDAQRPVILLLLLLNNVGHCTCLDVQARDNMSDLQPRIRAEQRSRLIGLVPRIRRRSKGATCGVDEVTHPTTMIHISLSIARTHARTCNVNFPSPPLGVALHCRLWYHRYMSRDAPRYQQVPRSHAMHAGLAPTPSPRRNKWRSDELTTDEWRVERRARKQ